MNFILKPPLEHIALVKVAAILWNQHDIRALVLEFLKSPLFLQLERCLDHRKGPLPRRKKWQSIESKVSEKMPQLIIPMILKEKLLGYIQAVGLQILKWMEYHYRFGRLNLNICLDLNLPAEFCWTPQGTINQKKTALVLIKDEQLDITTRYKLACMYCLVGHIRELWNKLPQNEKKSFFNEKDSDKVWVEDLIVFQGIYVQEEISNLDAVINNNLMKCDTYLHFSMQCALNGNKVAFEHFFEIVRNVTREKFLIDITMKLMYKTPEILSKNLAPPEQYFTELIFSLFSQMKNQQQTKLVEKHSRYILVYLLDWPWQGLLIKAAGHLQNFLSENDYYFICTIMLYKIDLGFKDCDYQKLYLDFWQQIPHAQKISIMSTDKFLKQLWYLFHMKNKKIIKFIIQDVPSVEKIKILFSDMLRSLFVRMINFYEWHYLRFFFQVCISSMDEVKLFAQIFKNCVKRKLEKFPEDTTFILAQYDEVFQFITDVCVKNKRKFGDEDDSNPAKRLCRTVFEDFIMHDPKK